MPEPIPITAPPLPNFTTSNTASYVKEVQTYFRLFDPDKTGQKNIATPRFLFPFLEFLRVVTEDAEKHAPAKKGIASVPSFAGDMARWKERLALYTRDTHLAIAQGEIDSHTAVLHSVSAPLLLGIYSQPPPAGVKVDDEGRGILDAVTPITLAHQANVSSAVMDAAWSQLGSDLVESAGATASQVLEIGQEVVARAVGFWLLLSAAGASVIALGVGAYFAFRKPEGERARR